jgi:hypothetical protein
LDELVTCLQLLFNFRFNTSFKFIKSLQWTEFWFEFAFVAFLLFRLCLIVLHRGLLLWTFAYRFRVICIIHFISLWSAVATLLLMLLFSSTVRYRLQFARILLTQLLLRWYASLSLIQLNRESITRRLCNSILAYAVQRNFRFWKVISARWTRYTSLQFWWLFTLLLKHQIIRYFRSNHTNRF